MSTATHPPICTEAVYRQGQICDGMKVRFPIAVNQRLVGQSDEKLNHIEIGHFGLSWPDLDEDLSHEGLRRGRFGQN